MVGVWVNMLIADAHSVPIDILNAFKLCFDAIHSEILKLKDIYRALPHMGGGILVQLMI